MELSQASMWKHLLTGAGGFRMAEQLKLTGLWGPLWASASV